jgi:signal transduction histidine kinase/CheY-like chemotaxis protein
LERTLHDGSVVHADNCTLEALGGDRVPIDLTVAPIQTEGGPVRGAVLVFRDVTERQRQVEEKEHLQAQLLQAQKMEALGILAGGIAHDFNNLMTTVIGYSSLALADLEKEGALYRRLAAIQWAGERAAALTQQILALSKRDPARPQVLQLNAVLGRLEEVLRRVLGPDIELVLSLDPDLAPIEIDPVHIERVLVSLVTNAYEAIAGPGTVTIQTRNGRAGDERPPYLPPEEDDRYVCLSVADTGVGLDEDTRQHIFEPFFSTKDKGAGLGLSVTYGLVHQRGGWIDVASQPGQGATFRVYLPAVSGTLDAPVVAGIPLAHAPGSGQRILLVEDEAHVRAPIAEMLRSDGYEVVAVGGVEQAHLVFAREQGAFDLVFSDVSLPDGDGLQLVADLLVAQPNLKVLLSSGHIDRAAQWPTIRERGYRFLAKPYGLQDLLPAVYRAISGA